MSQVKSHDGVALRLDRGGQNVPVFWVGQVQSLDQTFVAFDKAVWDRSIHELTGTLELLRIQLRPAFQKRRHPLIVGSHSSNVRGTIRRPTAPTEDREAVPDRGR